MRRFRLESTHERGDIRPETGFDFDAPAAVPLTPPPSAEELDLLRGPVARLVAADYPDFAKRVWGLN
jgi:glutaconate CoA-transferase subunit B